MPDITREELTAEEIRRQRKASQDMADIEFQMDIAPNLNYQGPIDPSLARLRTTDMDKPTNVRGYRIPPIAEYAKREFRDPEEAQRDYANASVSTKYMGSEREVPLPFEAGAVSVVNPSNARPEIWAHEYRHAQGLGRDEERMNRKIDAWNAQNKQQWDDAVEMERWQQGDGKSQAPRDETEAKLIKALKTMRIPKRLEDMFVSNPYFARPK